VLCGGPARIAPHLRTGSKVAHSGVGGKPKPDVETDTIARSRHTLEDAVKGARDRRAVVGRLQALAFGNRLLQKTVVAGTMYLEAYP